MTSSGMWVQAAVMSGCGDKMPEEVLKKTVDEMPEEVSTVLGLHVNCVAGES